MKYAQLIALVFERANLAQKNREHERTDGLKLPFSSGQYADEILHNSIESNIKVHVLKR